MLNPRSVDLIGYAAGVLTTVAFCPQVWKTWRSKSVKDFSPVMLAMFTTGVLLWLLYGLAQASTPMILANGATLAMAIFLLVMRFRQN